MQLVIASRNLHVVRELRGMLLTLAPGSDILSLHQFPTYSSPEETGNGFQECAKIKAIHAAKELNQWVLADDSDLVIPALGGLAGALQRRSQTKGTSERELCKHILTGLKTSTDLERAAYMECALALAGPQGLKKCVSGICEGMIATNEKGRNGFGYDPIFIKHDYEKTFAELEDSIRNRISHRRKAVERMALVLEGL